MNREELNVHAMENYNHNCILAHGCPILLEIADKLVDFFVANNYAVRNISNLHSPYGFLCHWVKRHHCTLRTLAKENSYSYCTGDDSEDETGAAINQIIIKFLRKLKEAHQRLT